MVAYRILFLAGAVAALPLNINLGAYSPALVVGTIFIPKNIGIAYTWHFIHLKSHLPCVTSIDIYIY